MWQPVISMSPSSLLYFICCKMSSLVRCNAKWNNSFVNKVFCQCMDASFGKKKNTTGRKSKSTSRVGVYVSEIKILPLTGWRWLTDSPQEWCCGRGSQCWPLLLAGWPFSRDCRQRGCRKWTSMSLSLRTGSITASLATLTLRLSGKDRRC